MGCLCPTSEIADQNVIYNQSFQPTNQRKPSSPLNSSQINIDNILILEKEPDKSAQQYRVEGNNAYNKKNYVQAIEKYQKAITLQSSNHIYYRNLALAYKANLQYQKSIDTIDEMLTKPAKFQNAATIAKGKIVKSRCIIIMVKEYCLAGKYTEQDNKIWLQKIQSSIDLLSELLGVPNTKTEVQKYLESGHKIRKFLVESVIENCKSQKLVSYLYRKFKQDKLHFQETKLLALNKYYPSKQSLLEQVQKFVQKEKIMALDEEIQQFITDPITYEVFKSPVIVPSGLTYDEAILRQHFMKNAYNDPITHQAYPIGEKVLIRNNCMQQYIYEIGKTVTKDDIAYLNC